MPAIFRFRFSHSHYTGGASQSAETTEAAVPEQAQDTSADTPAEAQAAPAPADAQGIIKPLEEAPPDFDFWEDLRASLPPWVNEVVGFALIVFGILSFISLYIAADALVAVTWADMLTSLFGDGAIFVAGALFAFGLLLWLPKVGIRVRLSSARLLALEIVFLSLLALLHLANSDSELRALARAGQGGGLIGWGLSYPFFWIMGRSAALAFFCAVIGICAVVVVGLRRRHLASVLSRLGGNLQRLSERARSEPAEEEDDARQIYERLAESPAYRNQIMRIRPNPANLPEDLRETRETSGGETRFARVSANRPSRPAQAEATASEPDSEAALEAVDASATEDAPPPAQAPLEWTGALPSMDCLTAAELRLPSDEEIQRKAKLIQNTLLEFDLATTVVDVQVGPTVTRYALQPHKEDGSDRIRMSAIAAYARDLSLTLAAKRLRLQTPVPGTNYMGIEVPNEEAGVVALRNVMESERFQAEARDNPSPLLIPLGRNLAGEPVSLDLAQMPHLLIAGATGSGKSVCMAALAVALLMRSTPDQLRLVMLDPKMVELGRFNGVPHLIGPVEIERERIIGVLRWCATEMDRRYKLLEAAGARDISAYNDERAAGEALPYVVIFIDEIGDLMLGSPEEAERWLARLAQMARAVGMHLVVATQRPSVDVITGLIKANFPSRIAFAVASSADSRVILDRAGAENLLGKGDMLLRADAAEAQRIQGCFVSEDDARAVVQHWLAQAEARAGNAPGPAADDAPWAEQLKRSEFIAETDPMLEEALRLVAGSGEASASLIQRRLGLGHPRAARIMDLLEELGIVGEETGAGRSRKVLLPPDSDPLEFALKRYLKEKPPR